MFWVLSLTASESLSKDPYSSTPQTLEHFTLPDPIFLDWNNLDADSLASAISEMPYEVCHNAKQRLVPSDRTRDENLWRRILCMHRDKELRSALGWDRCVLDSFYSEEHSSDDEFEEDFNA